MSEKEGKAALKLRRRFMRPSYVPREDPDQPASQSEVDVLPSDPMEIQPGPSHPSDSPSEATIAPSDPMDIPPGPSQPSDVHQSANEPLSHFIECDSDSDEEFKFPNPATSDFPDQQASPSEATITPSDPMDIPPGPSQPSDVQFADEPVPRLIECDSDSDEEFDFPDPATSDFPISLSHELVELSPKDEIQFAAIETLNRLRRQEKHSTSASDSDSEEEIPEWEQYSDEEEEEAVEYGKKLVMRFGDQPIADLDARWFMMIFPEFFPNCQGLPPPGVSIKRWLKHLVLRDGSMFQRAAFVCAVGDWMLRHGVNLAAYLQFKSSPEQFYTANQATPENVKRAAEILAKSGHPKPGDLPPVKALVQQVQAVAARTPGSPYNAMAFRRHLFAASVHFGSPAVFFTINPLESRSPFCWKLAGAENELRYFPLPGQPALPETDDWAMIQLVRKRPIAQAIFFREVIESFLEVACGFKKGSPYSQSVDENGKALGFFGPLDRVNMKVEESGRMAQHVHGLLGSRFFKLHNVTAIMDAGSAIMLRWMGSVAKCVMGSRMVALAEDGITPLPRLPPSYTQGVDASDEIIKIPRRKRSELMSTLLPRVDLLPSDQAELEMQNHITVLKHAELLHDHSTRCIPKTPGGKGNDTDCAEGFRPGPGTIKEAIWNSDTQEIRLPRDRTRLLSHNEFTLLAEKCNINFVFIGDQSARQPMTEDENLPLAEFCKRVTFYCSKYGSKVDAHQGEQLILNLLAAQIRTEEEESNRPKILITRCANALHK